MVAYLVPLSVVYKFDSVSRRSPRRWEASNSVFQIYYVLISHQLVQAMTSYDVYTNIKAPETHSRSQITIFTSIRQVGPNWYT